MKYENIVFHTRKTGLKNYVCMIDTFEYYSGYMGKNPPLVRLDYKRLNVYCNAAAIVQQKAILSHAESSADTS